MIVVESRSGGELKGGSRELGNFDSRARMTGIISSRMPLMTTTTCVMLSLLIDHTVHGHIQNTFQGMLVCTVAQN